MSTDSMTPEGGKADLTTENARFREALTKIDTIRNSIIGLQTMDWSEHIYPLVAALDEAGFEGMSYTEARGMFGTMLERTNAAEDRTEALEAALRPFAGLELWTDVYPDGPLNASATERRIPIQWIVDARAALPHP